MKLVRRQSQAPCLSSSPAPVTPLFVRRRPSIRAFALPSLAVVSFILGCNLGARMSYELVPPAKAESRMTRCPSTMKGNGVPTFKLRDELGAISQSEGFTIGVELGVKRGKFAQKVLSRWPSCSEYHLVDLWAHQENYRDIANVNQREQDQNYQQAMRNVHPWKEKIRVCRNFTTICVDNYGSEYFDFIYVDARHDYKGVWEDITSYWPKLKVGGIMAGHDYVTQVRLEIKTGL